MNAPLEHLVELRVCIRRAERRTADLPVATHNQREDLRAQTLGELVSAIDRIEPGLGTRLFLAMYPAAHAQGNDRRRAA